MDGDTIIFSAVQERSSAVYQCNASNEYGYLLANAFVNVLGKKKMLVFFSLLDYSLVLIIHFIITWIVCPSIC